MRIVLGNGVIEEQVRNEFCFSSVDKVNKDRNYLSLLKSNPSIKIFITTNFDPVIETCLGFSKDKVYLPSNLLHCNDILDNIRYGKRCIIKLHGTASQPESIILTGKSFRSMYKQDNTVLQELVDYLWNKSVLLFLGCGLKSDYLIEYFQTLASSKKTNWHYAILPYPSESELIKRRRELINLKIRPIWYENGKHEQIFTILSLITENYSFLNTPKDFGKLEKKQGDNKFNTYTDIKDEKNLSESTLIINNGDVGSQKTLNIKYLNGNITL